MPSINLAALVSWVPRRPYLAMVLCTAFFTFFAAHIPYARQVNNVDYFTIENEDYIYFQNFKRIFPKSEFFTVTFKDHDIFTVKNLTLIRKLTEDFLEMPEVIDVRSLANVDYTVGDDELFTVRKFLESVPTDPAELQKLKQEALAEPLYVQNIISKDGKTTSLAVFVNENKEDDSYRRALLQKVDEILDKYRGEAQTDFHLVGWTVTNLALSQTLNRDLMTFLPLTYIFISGTIYFIFRNFTLVALAVVNLSVCMISIVGLFGVTGITINNLTSIALPVGITLCLADTIHIFSHLDRQHLLKFPDHRSALSALLGSVVRPCLFTSLTTAIGFGSLAVSSISAMQDFATIACIAMVFEFFYSFFLLPALISVCDPNKTFASIDSASDARLNRFLHGLFDFVKRRYKAILGAALVISALGGWFTLKVPVETNLIKYFRESSLLRRSIDFVERNLGGMSPLDISLTAAQEDGFKDPQAILYIDRLSTFIKSTRGIDSVITLADFFKEMNKSFHAEKEEFYTVPDSLNQIEQYLLLYDGKDLRDVVNSSFDHTRISARMTLHSTREQEAVLRAIDDFVVKNPPPSGITVRQTGFAVDFVNVAHEMVDSQISSFGTAVLIICGLMSFFLRSIRMGVLSLVPNVFPIFLTFGLMGLVGIPLDTGTVMIASIALGIACDDTVHFLFDYQAQMRSGLTRPEALRHVILHKGRAIVATSIILTLGFIVLIFGDFVPIVNFGTLCSFTMLTAISGDLLLLPSIILAADKIEGVRREQKKG